MLSPGASDSAQTRLVFRLTLVSLFALYLALGATGFGTDGDSYAMIRSGIDLWRHGVYAPSRAPGYPLPELVLGAATLAGGILAANAISAVLAVVALFCFHRLLRDPLGERVAWIAMLSVGVNPYWILTATSSMDYVYGASFFLAGLVALRAKRPWGAAVLFALCAASRVTYAPAILGTYIALRFFRDPETGARPIPRLRWLASAGIFLGLTFLAYLPGLLVSGGHLFEINGATHGVSFFGWSGLGSPAAHLGRFAYKNVFLWGIPAFCIVALAKVDLLRGLRALDATPRRVLAFLTAAILYFELLFLRLPLEIAYLLPVLFLAVAAVGFLPRARVWLAALCLAQAVQGLVSFDLVEVRYASRSLLRVEANGVRFAPGWHRGPVLQDLAAREEARRFYFGLHLPALREEDFRPLNAR